MSVSSPVPSEVDLRRIVAAVRALCEGRSNAVGSFTLTASATTTTVTAPTCGAGSKIMFAPETANAAAALATTYFGTPVQGSVVITHANASSSDRVFRYSVIG